MGLFSRKKSTTQYPAWLSECPQDQEVLKSHLDIGSDLAKPFAVDAFLYFPTKEAAEKAGAKLRMTNGWTVVVSESPDHKDWSVVANHATYLLDQEGVHALRSLFEGLATEFGGEYDGWGAPVNVVEEVG